MTKSTQRHFYLGPLGQSPELHDFEKNRKNNDPRVRANTVFTLFSGDLEVKKWPKSGIFAKIPLFYHFLTTF